MPAAAGVLTRVTIMLCRLFTLAVALACLSGCSAINSSPYHALVKQNPSSPNHYTSIQAAIDAAPSANKKPHRIYISAGDYFEKIIIAKPNIQLIGAHKTTTRIYYDAYAGQQSTEAGATPGQIWGTTGAATLIIRAADIQLHHLTLENTFDFLRNDALHNDDPQRILHTQAPALHLDNGSDRFLARDLRILGYQDTLFINSGRSWFDQVMVAGNIDFIFGKGNALFTKSEIKTRPRARASNPHGYITAPSTNIHQKHGFTFIDCVLTREKNVPDNSVALGRPWHPTTQFNDGRYADPHAIGKAIFINTWMDAHITENGWHSMTGTAKDGKKIQFDPAHARFFEYKNKGPGARINADRRQLSDSDLKNSSVKKILGVWPRH